jgi:hypothetical protein
MTSILKRLLAGALALCCLASGAAAESLLRAHNILEARLGAERLVLHQPSAASAPYAPLGVTIDPATIIGIPTGPLGVTNTTQHTLAYWLNATRTANASPNILNSYIFLSDYAGLCETTGGKAPRICISYDNSAAGLQISFNNSVGVSTSTDSVKFTAPSAATMNTYNGGWHHYLISFDTSAGVWAVYIDGAPAGFNLGFLNSGAQPDFNNKDGWSINNGVPQGGFGIAEVYESTSSIVCTGSNLPAGHGCAAANTIFPDVLARMVSGTGAAAR